MEELEEEQFRGLLWRYDGLALAVIRTEASLAQENYSSSHVLLTLAFLGQGKGKLCLGCGYFTVQDNERPLSFLLPCISQDDGGDPRYVVLLVCGGGCMLRDLNRLRG